MPSSLARAPVEDGQQKELEVSLSKVLPCRLPVAQFPVRNQHSRQLGAGTHGGC